MRSKAIIIGVVAIAALGGSCKTGTSNNAPSNAANEANAAPPAVNRTPAPSANANSNSNSAAKTDSSPKRISFAKGADWGAANVTLAPGGSQRFVVGAKSGQTMSVESSSKELSVNLTKGKAETTEDFGFLNAELQTNGDFVFEVRNSTKKEIKASIKVTIEGGSEDTAADDNTPNN